MSPWAYSDGVVADVLEHAEMNPHADLWRYGEHPKPSTADEVRELPPRVVAHAYMEWHGLIGWARRVWSILDTEGAAPRPSSGHRNRSVVA